MGGGGGEGGGIVIGAAADFLQVRQVCYVRTGPMEDFFFFCPIGDKHWGEDGWRVFVCDTEEEPAMCEYM